MSASLDIFSIDPTKMRSLPPLQCPLQGRRNQGVEGQFTPPPYFGSYGNPIREGCVWLRPPLPLLLTPQIFRSSKGPTDSPTSHIFLILMIFFQGIPPVENNFLTILMFQAWFHSIFVWFHNFAAYFFPGKYMKLYKRLKPLNYTRPPSYINA